MNTPAAGSAPKPLRGWRVLVPRGGPWGDSVAAALRAQGAVPVIAPLINFAPSEDPTSLEEALRELAQGTYPPAREPWRDDWREAAYGTHEHRVRRQA